MRVQKGRQTHSFINIITFTTRWFWLLSSVVARVTFGFIYSTNPLRPYHFFLLFYFFNQFVNFPVYEFSLVCVLCSAITKWGNSSWLSKVIFWCIFFLRKTQLLDSSSISLYSDHYLFLSLSVWFQWICIRE